MRELPDAGGVGLLSGFIKLTQRTKRRKLPGKPLWVSPDKIIAIEEDSRGGSSLILYVGDLFTRSVHVCEKPMEILAVSEVRRDD